MTTDDRTTLLAAVIDAPDDGDLRLVLMDYLLEHGGQLPFLAKPEWLRCNGYWRIGHLSGLWWCVLFSSARVYVGDVDRDRILCEDCTLWAVLRWPIWRPPEFAVLLGKRWLCLGCYEARVMEGSIHTDRKRLEAAP